MYKNYEKVFFSVALFASIFFGRVDKASAFIDIEVISSKLITEDLVQKISNILPSVLVSLANEDRFENGQGALTRSLILDNAALLKAEDMASSQYFAHTSPAGLSPWYWFNKVGYLFISAGENLAIGFTESKDVENAWLNSPGHKGNIMSNLFTEIGVASVDGYYQGFPTTFVVQMFGAPVFKINK